MAVGLVNCRFMKMGRGGGIYLTQTLVSKSNHSPLHLYYLGLIVLLGL